MDRRPAHLRVALCLRISSGRECLVFVCVCDPCIFRIALATSLITTYVYPDIQKLQIDAPSYIRMRMFDCYLIDQVEDPKPVAKPPVRIESKEVDDADDGCKCIKMMCS